MAFSNGMMADSAPMLSSSAAKGAAAGASAPGQASAADSSAAPSTPLLRLDTGAVSTPLFTAVTTRVDGRGVATFTAPTNLGTFVIR